jgi:circadian clock protein KaiB
MNPYVLRLFVTGNTPRTERAIANLRRICEMALEGNYRLTVIDVLERPQLAEEEKVVATPMLIKEAPPPTRRIIGDLSASEQVLMGLNLDLPDAPLKGGGREFGRAFERKGLRWVSTS